MQRLLFSLLLFIVILHCSLAAVTGKWRVYTAKKEVRDVVALDSIAWVATSGGAFSYDMRSGVIEQITTAEGLHSIDLTAITADNGGNIWMGASNGALHQYSPNKKNWVYISDIADLQSEPQKRIHGLTTLGDTLCILSDLGVSIFLISGMEFGDTYRMFGLLPNRLDGNVVAFERFQNSYWVATPDGIAATPTTNPNPSEPASWQIVNSGLPSTTVHDLAVYHDTLFAATALGLAWYNGTSWQTVPQTAGRNVQVLSPTFGERESSQNPSLYFSVDNQLWRYEVNFVGVSVNDFTSEISSLASPRIVGTINNGILIDSSVFGDNIGANWKEIIPHGPPYNIFTGMEIDNNGVFWAGTGAATGGGFMSFDGTTWQRFTPETLPQLNDFRQAYLVDIGLDNSKWISSFGQGIVHLDKENKVEGIYNSSNGLSYTKTNSDDSNFVVVTGAATDRNGETWINVRSAQNRKLLAVSSPEIPFIFRYASYPEGFQIPILTNIVIDHYGTKWFTSLSDVGNSSPGLVFYDETLRLPRRLQSGSGWGIIRKEVDPSLTDNEITALAVDLDGSLWVGTSQGGVNIIIDPSVPYRILPYHPITGKRINDILVDPLNQKWVATEEGVFLLSPDGTIVLEHFTSASTEGKLPDDRVSDLAMNIEDGTVYFSTTYGLSLFTTAAVNPRASFDELKIFPNPYVLPSQTLLTIDGLVENSTIKILSVSGNLVREIVTPGGRVGFWDGADDDGNQVASGIYIVTAFSKDGSQVGNGKVAVVRK